MLNQLFNFLKAKTVRFKYSRTLGSITDMEDFRKLIEKVQPRNFLRYQNASSCKRLEFRTVIDKLQIILSGKHILDIGPAFGDSLDICYEEGAKAVHFVENDLFFFTYNKLKGFTKGYQIDHRRKLSELEGNKYDLIWVKGAFSADRFITRTNFSRFMNLESWLMQIERIASSSCQIIICPHWLNDCGKRNIENVKHNLFTETMMKNGYTILPKIKNHNGEPQYPITFFKERAKRSARLGRVANKQHKPI